MVAPDKGMALVDAIMAVRRALGISPEEFTEVIGQLHAASLETLAEMAAENPTETES